MKDIRRIRNGIIEPANLFNPNMPGRRFLEEIYRLFPEVEKAENDQKYSEYFEALKRSQEVTQEVDEIGEIRRIKEEIKDIKALYKRSFWYRKAFLEVKRRVMELEIKQETNFQRWHEINTKLPEVGEKNRFDCPACT